MKQAPRPEQVWKNFGAVLRSRRRELSLTLSSVSQRIGVSITYLAKIERGEVPPPADEVIRKMARVLRLGLPDLFWVAGQLSPSARQIVAKNARGFEEMARFTAGTSFTPPMVLGVLREILTELPASSVVLDNVKRILTEQVSACIDGLDDDRLITSNADQLITRLLQYFATPEISGGPSESIPLVPKKVVRGHGTVHTPSDESRAVGYKKLERPKRERSGKIP